MKLDSAMLLPQISNLLNEYYRYRRYATDIKRDFIFNTFFEKLINLLGWDPWNKNDYIPFFVEIGHELYYGARLFLPNKESIVALVLDDAQISSPTELKDKKVNMSFYMRMALLAVYEKIRDENIKVIWISSISKNYFYHYPNEIPIHYFSCETHALENIQRTVILNKLFPSLRLKNVMEIGTNVALWLRKWEGILIEKGGLNTEKARDVLDLLMCVAMIGRSNISDIEPTLLDNLVLKYYLSMNREFFLDIDFSQVLPTILENFKKTYSFNFYNGIGFAEIKRLPDELLVGMVEELVSLARISFSLECLNGTYHILEDENFSREWTFKKPLLSLEVDICERTFEDLENLVVHVDGENIGLVLGTYDRLEKMYEKLCAKYNNFLPASQYHNDFDLLCHNTIQTAEPIVTVNFAKRILEKNLKIVHCCPARKRTLNILLIRKIITSYEKYNPKDITFPFISLFSNP